MVNPWVRYDDIEEKRNGYKIVYSPVFTGEELAILKINIYAPLLLKNVKKIAELELKIWAFRYAVPTIVMISNRTKSNQKSPEVIGHHFLLGYKKNDELICYWDEYPKNKEPDIELSKTSLANIYSDLSFKTHEGVITKKKNAEVEEQKKKPLFIVAIVALWLCIIPGFIIVLGWSNPILSFSALIYSLMLAFQKAREFWRENNKPNKQVGKDKADVIKDHHHYHCLRNPEAFIALRTENFKRDRMEKDSLKIESLRH